MTTLANPRSLWDTLPAEIAEIITGLAAAPIILIQRMFRGAAVRRRVNDTTEKPQRTHVTHVRQCPAQWHADAPE